MLLAQPPLRLKFYVSAALITSVLVGFVYHFWALDIRPLTVPPRLPTGIPKKIWYKLGPSGLSNRSRMWTESCLKNNTNYEYEFMTDNSAEAYVRKAFASRPDIVETYTGVSIPILRADLLRYLLLFDKGGIWSDLDVSCEGAPIDEWIPHEYKGNASLVVGWEFDVGWGEEIIRQFQSWTIMSKPGLPHMAMVIQDIVDALKNKTIEHKVSLGGLTLGMLGRVEDMTGPRRLTRSVLKSLEQSMNKAIPIDDIKNLVEPKLVGDVLIMPGYSFATSANRYGENGPPGPPLVQHHYAGSWKNSHGGEDAAQ
ncbi:glycosyltransferase family 32 protein [Pleomassaria siparia CBS 279.74]|uniref:Glycosyltransferase family 32 protein n=1 Tax=Pleomassaria siparia CBS 279.74 TaxID=1314801 RepID=A0A6G1K749_9PLEO|nr:glycosyltransferase family 32 protein [Pleomassaria siparia CBS 279.74]